MNDNGLRWTWIVASMPGVGDVAMEVPVDFLRGRHLPDEFTARRLTVFRLTPKQDGVGADISMVAPMLVDMGAMGQECRIRSERLAYYAPASADAVAKLTQRWSPIARPPAGALRRLEGKK